MVLGGNSKKDDMKKQNRNGQQLAVQELSATVLLFDAPFPDSLSDDEIEALMCQEPLRPNQGFMLPAEEQPTEENEECTYPA